jgi:hypothetical protein
MSEGRLSPALAWAGVNNLVRPLKQDRQESGLGSAGEKIVADDVNA